MSSLSSLGFYAARRRQFSTIPPTDLGAISKRFYALNFDNQTKTDILPLKFNYFRGILDYGCHVAPWFRIRQRLWFSSRLPYLPHCVLVQRPRQLGRCGVTDSSMIDAHVKVRREANKRFLVIFMSVIHVVDSCSATFGTLHLRSPSPRTPFKP